MTARRTLLHLLPAALAVAATGFPASRSFATSGTTVAALIGETHFHGIAADPRDPDRLYLETHHGLFVVSPDGQAPQVSDPVDDVMGLPPPPPHPDLLYASGHPAGGGHPGIIVSRAGGTSLSTVATGTSGTADIQQ